MNRKSIVIMSVAFAIILASLIFYFALQHGGSAQALTGGKNTPSGSGPQELQYSQYAPFSYKIFPGKPSPEAQTAMIGFVIENKTFSNGTSDVNLSVNGAIVARVSVPLGDSLYFIETSSGDDFGTYDSSLGDDGVLLVNQSGYIV